MNKVVLVYTCPTDSDKEFIPCAIRWSESYKKFDAGYPHELTIVFCNGKVKPHHRKIFEGIEYKERHFNGCIWDVAVYLGVSPSLTKFDLAVYLNARSHFHKSGWLKRLMEAREENFDVNGLYGISVSCETVPHLGRGPHVRTAAFAVNPNTLNRYPYQIHSRETAFMFESGKWNLTNFHLDNGWPVYMVTWDGVYQQPDWRKPANVFRKGDQSNMLVWDRHTEIYRLAPPQEKVKLQCVADGQ